MKRNINATIVADVKRLFLQINTGHVFGAQAAGQCVRPFRMRVHVRFARAVASCRKTMAKAKRPRFDHGPPICQCSEPLEQAAEKVILAVNMAKSRGERNWNRIENIVLFLGFLLEPWSNI
jgi:hypothetical protein